MPTSLFALAALLLLTLNQSRVMAHTLEPVDQISLCVNQAGRVREVASGGLCQENKEVRLPIESTGNTKGVTLCASGNEVRLLVLPATHCDSHEQTIPLAIASSPTLGSASLCASSRGKIRSFVAPDTHCQPEEHTLYPLKAAAIAPKTASLCAVGGFCQLGDTGPGGGKMIYLDGTGLRGWEAAPGHWSHESADPIHSLTAALSRAKAYRGGKRHDWTLPPIEILQALYQQKDSVGGISFPPRTPPVTSYWSQSDAPNKPQDTQTVDFNNGAIGFEDKNNKHALARVRPVRKWSHTYTRVCYNGTFEGNKHCTGTVVANNFSYPVGQNTDWACTKDDTTGLIWSLAENSETWNYIYIPFNPNGNNNYPNPITDANHSGRCGYHHGWRLPTCTELKALVKPSVQPTIDSTYFPGTNDGVYWCSNDPHKATSRTVVNFETGDTGILSESGYAGARLVHP